MIGMIQMFAGVHAARSAPSTPPRRADFTTVATGEPRPPVEKGPRRDIARAAPVGAALAIAATTLAGAPTSDDTMRDAAATPTPRVLITEIMYNPASDESRGQSEWVEIANLGSVAVEIVNWRLDDEDTRPADQWGTFSCRLLPGQVAVLISDEVSEEEFRRAWDEPESASETGYLVIPVKWGSLANTPSSTNEILALRTEDDHVVCEVNFESGNGWPRVAGLGGPSIHLVDLDTTNLSNPAIWKVSVADDAGARLVNGTDIFNGADVGSPGRLPPRTPATKVDAQPTTNPAAGARQPG